MDLQDLLTALDVGVANHDLAVEASGTEKSGIEYITAVSGSDHDNALVAGKAVHFNKELVEGLLTLVMASAESGASVTADSVDLVDEDDSRSVFFGLLEQISHTGGSHAHEHLNEVRAGDREEGAAGLAGHSSCKQCLTCSGRSQQQHALRHLSAQL